jgi:hypothetical protein
VTDEIVELKPTVQALALDAEAQIALFPDFVFVGDEMVSEFGEAVAAYRRSRSGVDSPMQALSALDAHIDELTTVDDDDLWFDPDRLRQDAAWARMRELAQDVLAAFGWPQEVPAKNGAVYVGADRTVKND